MADVGRPTPIGFSKIEVTRDIRNGVRRNNYWDYDIGPDETLSTDLVRAFSTVEGRDVCSLPPFAEALDPAALDTSSESRLTGRTRIGGKVTFVYADCVVDVDNGEYLSVELLGSIGADGRDGAPGHRDAE
jgi:hypothetical protein